MQKQLPDGLILRSLSENHISDREALPAFYGGINTADDPEEEKNALMQWVRDLMNNHSTVTWDDMFVVIDPAKNDMLVSATLLIPQVWEYEGIQIKVGRPELVATHPDYRKRGLVRALFDTVHERSASLGHQLQVITGIPYFYRQFGYTMAVDLGQHASYFMSQLAEPAPDYKPAYTLRSATDDDIPALMTWRANFARQRLLMDSWNTDQWHYEINGRHPGAFLHTEHQVIVNAEGKGVGYLTMLSMRELASQMRCVSYIVGDQASYLETFPDVMQAVKRWALAKYGECPPMLGFSSGIHETLDTLIDRSIGGVIRRREYAWYIRIPDTIAFLKMIAPVLERRLEDSGANRFTGELKIGFFDLTGISLRFEHGCLKDVVSISGKDGYDVQFPWYLFWNIVFGYHTTEEIRHILPDTFANAKATVLLDTLFPKKKSHLLGFA